MLNRNKRKILEFFANNDTQTVNVNQISRLLNISVGSAHKILLELKAESILISKNVGNSTVYKLDITKSSKSKIIAMLKQANEKVKKTKIICTIGPSCKDPLVIEQMIAAGMNVARINGSHGDFKSHAEIIKIIRQVSDSIPIMIDMPGSKIRLGDLQKDILIKKGDEVIFADIKYARNFPETIGVMYDEVHEILEPGNRIVVDDGNLGFSVEKISGERIYCRTLNSGIIQSRKGFHLPDLAMKYEELTEKDLQFIEFAIEQDIEFIGLSFTNNREHVRKVNKLIGKNNLRIIAKIETRRGLNNYKEIIEEAYGLMIDRGDLGGETSPESIPLNQKEIINECNRQGKPIIVATQLLDSMIKQSFPRKSEISDVANAVLDGTSALLLSAETAVGAYPIETVRTMSKIISNVEEHVDFDFKEDKIKIRNITDSITRAIKSMAKDGDIDKIICITSGGYSSRIIARHKLNIPIIAVTSDAKVYRQLNLVWGVIPVLINRQLDNMLSMEQKRDAINLCLKKKLITPDDNILINGAVFPDNRKMTNLIEVHKVREFAGFFQKEVKLIEPHGGVLINRMVSNRVKATEEARNYHHLQVSRETLLDLANIGTGVFSPLEGFVNKEDFYSIVNKKRLSNGLVWTIPIVLQVKQLDREFVRGEKIALVDSKKNLFGVLHFEEAYSFEFNNVAKKVYGTVDLNHPGVRKFKDSGNICLAGKVDLINMPDSIVGMYELTPQQTREIFKKKGWRTIVGFQTRNVPHRAHEYLQKAALELVDGILIHPLIGWKKQGDYKPESIINGYKALIANYYPKRRVVLAAITTQMRYAGPREAVFHAIIRKNFGCSHFIVGGDHAGVGDYYGLYDAHKIFDEVKDIDITIIKLMRPYFCRKCGHIVSEKTCPHGDKHKFEVSGTLIRKMLSEGTLPPKELVREEVAKSLGKGDLNE